MAAILNAQLEYSAIFCFAKIGSPRSPLHSLETNQQLPRYPRMGFRLLVHRIVSLHHYFGWINKPRKNCGFFFASDQFRKVNWLNGMWGNPSLMVSFTVDPLQCAVQNPNVLNWMMRLFQLQTSPEEKRCLSHDWICAKRARRTE